MKFLGNLLFKQLKITLLISLLFTIYSFKAQSIIKAKNGEANLAHIQNGPNPTDFGTYDETYGPTKDVYEVTCTSTLAPQGKYTFAAGNLNDGKMNTAWAEGDKEYGIGTKINFTFLKKVDKDIADCYIINGYYLTEAIYKENSKVKKMKIYLNKKEIGILELNDYRGLQSFSLYQILPKGGSYNTNLLKKDDVVQFEILEVYPGTKYKDVCISEFVLIH